jgi:hypothetical protein
VSARITGASAANATWAANGTFVAVAVRLGGNISSPGSGCTAHGPREQPCVQAYAGKWYGPPLATKFVLFSRIFKL